MNSNAKQDSSNKSKAFGFKLGRKVSLKMRARNNKTQVWFGLGMMGLIGWSIIIPTLIGAAIGLWFDDHYPWTFSWTLALLVAGLCVGCFNAWHWVSKQHQDLKDELEKEDSHGNK